MANMKDFRIYFCLRFRGGRLLGVGRRCLLRLVGLDLVRLRGLGGHGRRVVARHTFFRNLPSGLRARPEGGIVRARLRAGSRRGRTSVIGSGLLLPVGLLQRGGERRTDIDG